MQPKMVVWLFFIAALLFMFAAMLPVLRGGEFNATLFVLAIVFAILGLTNFRKRRGGD